MAQRFNPRDVNFYGNLGSIGIPKFDSVIGGGIPRGFTIIARGDPGSGMELFAKQFVSPVEDPKKTFYLSTTEKDDEVRNLMQMYRWPSDLQIRAMGHEYNTRTLQRDLAASRLRLNGFSMADIQRLAKTRFVENVADDYLTDLAMTVTGLGHYYRVAVDSMDFFFQRNEPARVLSVMRLMQTHTQDNRGLLFITHSRNVVSSGLEGEIASLADILLDFEVHRMGTEFETRLTIRKFRNHPENMAMIAFRVTPEDGITPETVERIA